MRRVTVALAVALALTAIAIAVTLSGSPLVLARSNGIRVESRVAQSPGRTEVCQAGEVLPAGTSAIRLSLWSAAGPRLHLTALSGGHVLTSGVIASAWSTGAVTVPVSHVARTSSNVNICVSLDQSPEVVLFDGSSTNAARAARDSRGNALLGRIKIEYLRTGEKSWWAVAPSVAKRMGFGRAPSGAWVVLVLIVLMGALVVSTSWLALKELR